MADIDFNQLKVLAKEAEGDNEIELLPAGDYEVVVRSAKVKEAKTGNLYLALFLRVTSGPYAANGKLFWNLVFSDNSTNIAIVLAALNALGVQDLIDRNASLEEVAEALKGATATVSAIQKEFPKGSGNIKNEVTGLVRDGSGTQAATSAPATTGNVAAPVGMPF